MTFLGASLADGQVPDVQAAVYTVPTGYRAIIKTIDVVSQTATPQDVEFFVTRNGSSPRSIGKVSPLDQWEKIEYLSDGNSLSLSEDDSIEAVTTTAAAVDFTIAGAEELV